MEGLTSEDSVSNEGAVVGERMGTRIVSLLLLLAVVSVFVLWSVNPIGSGGESTFVLFLAVDLVSVAMISYIQRAVVREGHIARAPLLAGCFFILFLLAATFYLLS